MKLSEREWEELRLAGGARRGLPWNPKEIKDIEDCVRHGVNDARFIFEQGFFPGRSINAIRTKITEATARWQAIQKARAKREKETGKKKGSRKRNSTRS